MLPAPVTGHKTKEPACDMAKNNQANGATRFTQTTSFS